MDAYVDSNTAKAESFATTSSSFVAQSRPATFLVSYDYDILIRRTLVHNRDPIAMTMTPRTTSTVIVSLLFGILLNVLVAWGFTLWIGIDQVCYEQHGENVQSPEESWEIYRVQSCSLPLTKEVGALNVHSTRSRSPDDRSTTWGAMTPDDMVPPWSGLDEPTTYFRAGAIDKEIRIVYARGWPLLSLWCGVDYLYTGDSERRQNRWGFPVGGFEDDRGLDMLPLRPIGLGFTVNSLFFGIVVFILTWVVIVMRRYQRWSRGQCIVCAHYLRWNYTKPCSECGWAPTKRDSSAA